MNDTIQILILHEGPELRQAIARLMEPLPCRVALAVSVEQGLASAREQRPDLIICPVAGPSGDGFELSRRIRRDLAQADPQVWLVAAGPVTPGILTQALEAGAESCLSWPLSEAEITSRIRAFLRHRAVKLVAAAQARRGEELSAQLTAAQDGLAQAIRVKEEFLASMSHELRTPLTAISGFAESLADGIYGPVTSDQEEALGHIAESSRHLLALINDIFDFVKIESGRIELARETIAIETLCAESLSAIKHAAQSKKQKVTLSYEGGIRFIQGDAHRLKRVLVNLLDNAAKFTPEGGAIGLEVRSDAAQSTVQFIVWDTGIGIAPENAQRLFEPFVQLDSGPSRQYGGAGMGLTLAHRLTEMHEGQLTVTSILGKGSRFTVSLPVNRRQAPSPVAPDAPVVVTPEEPARLTEAPVRKTRILLVDDSELNIQVLERFLTVKGYELIVGRNGAEGLNLARQHQPHLILMDIEMPVMDGLEAIHQLRQDETMARIPIIALTALAMPGDENRCLAAGANDYLSKPVSLKALATTIEEILARPSKTR